jgi:hypothetical protein
MSTLLEAYAKKDKNRLEIGYAALEEIQSRVKFDISAGKTAPHRTILSEVLEELSYEFAKYHASQSSCRSYLRDSVRLARYFTPDLVEELEPYNLTSGHYLACVVAGAWPDADNAETEKLLDWAIENHASPQEIWDYRKSAEKELSEEEKSARRLVKSAEKYLEVTSVENGFEERRAVVTNLIKVFDASASKNVEEKDTQ